MLPREYTVEILDSSLNALTDVKSFVPINKEAYLEYYTQLSNYGYAKFRINTKDPLFTKWGNILQPWANHIRIKRYDATVWQGFVINCPHRTKSYVEVQAYDYIFALKKILIRHDTSGDLNYRTLQSGTMAQAVQTFLTEAISDTSANSIIKKIQVGTMQNPVFPPGFTNTSNQSTAGQPWQFGTTYNSVLKFDYKDAYTVIASLANYSQCDFQLIPITSSTFSLQFNFLTFLGNKTSPVYLTYGSTGQIDDYDSPLVGEKMVNDLTGLAADNNFNILKNTQVDTTSQSTYGKLQGAAAYNDVKNPNVLANRLKQELTLISQPDTQLNITLNEKAYPLNLYGLGDIIHVTIQDHMIQVVNKPRRIVGIDVLVAVDGRERIKLLTNPPRPTS